MTFTVLLGDQPLGTSNLERFDPGMGVASGRFSPLPAYEAVRPLFRRYAEALAVDASGTDDQAALTAFYQERDTLPLHLVDSAGVPVSTRVIHINDFSEEAGEEEGYELEVYLSERDPRFDTTVLYRPVGEKELELIRLSGWRVFPLRLEHQPIFYPVVSEEYAVQIARDWNTKDAASGYVGYVTRFAVEREYLAQYPVQRAGSKDHLEYWIPAEDLEEFNRHIVGAIQVIAEFRPEQGPHA